MYYDYQTDRIQGPLEFGGHDKSECWCECIFLPSLLTQWAQTWCRQRIGYKEGLGFSKRG